MKTIAVLVGSLRRASINHQYAKALEKLAAEKLTFDFLDVDLPLYNDDLWENPPARVTAIKADITAADGVLIVSPEYNRSIPAVTKNAIDWASRPYGHNAWKGKPVAITGASPGVIGTAVAQSQIRSSLTILGTAVMSDPEVYMHFKADLLDADYNISDAGTAKFLTGFLDSFDAWIDRTKV